MSLCNEQLEIPQKENHYFETIHEMSSDQNNLAKKNSLEKESCRQKSDQAPACDDANKDISISQYSNWQNEQNKNFTNEEEIKQTHQQNQSKYQTTPQHLKFNKEEKMLDSTANINNIEGFNQNNHTSKETTDERLELGNPCECLRNFTDCNSSGLTETRRPPSHFSIPWHLSFRCNGKNIDRVDSCFKRTSIAINVSGEIFETSSTTLEQFPNSLLGHPDKRKKFYNPQRNQYFFDRNRLSFNGILDFYQSGGRLRRPLSVPVDVFAEDIKFFHLGAEAMAKYQDAEGYEFSDEEYRQQGGTPLSIREKKEKLPSNKFQKKVWFLFEKPESSTAARIIAVVSILIIFLSVISFCLETDRNLNVFDEGDVTCYTNISNFSTNATSSTAANRICLPSFLHNPFWIIETICITWFTIELTCRFLSSPSKARFWMNMLNIIDLVAIIPYFVTMGSRLAAFAEGKHLDNEKEISLAFFRVIRLVRVFRIFKLSRHSIGLQILGKTLKSSVRELGLLLFFVLMGVVLFSSAVYFAEFESNYLENNEEVENTDFESIPAAFWWAIVTMTTVGYGDMHPKTPAGKLVGSICALCGILCLALPVPVIVSNFMIFYQRSKANKQRGKLQEEISIS